MEVMRTVLFLLATAGMLLAASPKVYPDIPRDYLAEADSIPDHWVSTVGGVYAFLDHHVQKGTVQQFGTTAGGRPMRAVFYGQPRSGKGTSTFSGSLGFGDVRAYFGADYARKVYMALGGVHGGELEGIVGLVNLISVLETGKDLKGKPWPEITAAAAKLDRIILVPVTNVDGRARVPVRMLKQRGRNSEVQQYWNTGAWANGKLIDWPTCKRDIPLDFSKTQFPGGYPNDAGVNLMHDDFFVHPQPETRALFEMGARERPDIIMNMHSGGDYTRVMREWIEPSLGTAFNELFRRTQTALTVAGLRGTDDVARESDPARATALGMFNLDSALNLNSGALVILTEAPSHGVTLARRDGRPFLHTTDMLIDGQLLCHQEAMKFLVETGGRTHWAAK